MTNHTFDLHFERSRVWSSLVGGLDLVHSCMIAVGFPDLQWGVCVVLCDGHLRGSGQRIVIVEPFNLWCWYSNQINIHNEAGSCFDRQWLSVACIILNLGQLCKQVMVKLRKLYQISERAASLCNHLGANTEVTSTTTMRLVPSQMGNVPFKSILSPLPCMKRAKHSFSLCPIHYHVLSWIKYVKTKPRTSPTVPTEMQCLLAAGNMLNLGKLYIIATKNT